jgi:hypothetical protein
MVSDVGKNISESAIALVNVLNATAAGSLANNAIVTFTGSNKTVRATSVLVNSTTNNVSGVNDLSATTMSVSSVITSNAFTLSPFGTTVSGTDFHLAIVSGAGRILPHSVKISNIKTFNIPHPLKNDPSQRLVHSCIEGPRIDLMYRGECLLENGRAEVDLDRECVADPEACGMTPGTFEALCRDPVVFVQNNQTWDKVRGSVVGGSTLVIESESESVCNVNVHWMVVAERQDPAVKGCMHTDDRGRLITEKKMCVTTHKETNGNFNECGCSSCHSGGPSPHMAFPIQSSG